MPNIETDVLDHKAAGNWAFVSLYGRILTQDSRALANFTSIPIPKLLDQIHLPPTAGKKQPSAGGRYNKAQLKWPGGEKTQTNDIFLFLLTPHGNECVRNFSVSIQLTKQNKKSKLHIPFKKLIRKQTKQFLWIYLSWVVLLNFLSTSPYLQDWVDQWHSAPHCHASGNREVYRILWGLSSE